jgi:cell division protein ZapE
MVPVRRLGRRAVWFDFAELCGGPRSQLDYLEIASRFDTVMVSAVPQMSPERAAEARRFLWLVDILYEQRVKLILSAQTSPDALYPAGKGSEEFARAVSRLTEMQARAYLESERRSVED